MAQYPGVQTESDPVAEADLAAHVAATDPHPGYQKESEKGAADGYASLDATGNVPLSQLANAPSGGGGGGADASSTVKGISKLSVDPASPTDPIAVGDNDPRNTDQRVPTDGSVTAAKVASSLKPSGSAASTDESLRRLGTGSTHAAAGDDSRFPTAGQKNALAGTSGTPGTGNEYVTTQDSRLSDARTPSAHAASHGSAGSDPVTIAESQVTNLVSDLAAKAPLASPTFTGTPAGPTAAQGTNTTQLATTAYVRTEAGLLIPKLLVDAKGDLLVATANDTVDRLAVGTDGQVLTADSAQAKGVKWATPSGGGSASVQWLDDFNSLDLAKYVVETGSFTANGQLVGGTSDDRVRTIGLGLITGLIETKITTVGSENIMIYLAPSASGLVNYLRFTYQAADGVLAISKVINSGALTGVAASSSGGALAAGTYYFRITKTFDAAGSALVSCRVYTTDPVANPNTSVVKSVSATTDDIFTLQPCEILLRSFANGTSWDYLRARR